MERSDIAALLADLNGIPGVSGFEDAVGARIKRHMEGLYDEEETDVLGNRLFIRHGAPDAPRVLITAHMDEIGFIVSDIGDEGLVRFLPVGFHDARLLQNQILLIQTESGDVAGTTGCGVPPHETKGQDPPAVRMGEVALDIGARSRQEALDMGVAPGDPIVSAQGGRMLGKRVFCGRAVDNRAGCAAMIAAMRLLSVSGAAATVIACATVQEELGAKGVQTAARRARPDIALCLDVCFAARGRAIPPSHARVGLGKGPAISVYDWSPGSLLGNIVPVRLRRRMIDTARRRRIPHQLEVTLDCGTDAAEIALSGTGVLTGGIGIPCRYMHSAVGAVDVGDIYYSAVLAAEVVKSLRDPL